MIITFKGKTTVSKEFDAPVLLSDALRQAGFAVDIGTTTVAVYAYELKSGKMQKVFSSA